MTRRKKRTAGIDRWRGGWIVASTTDRKGVELVAVPTIGAAIERLGDFDAVAIDIPIALAVSGRRAAEAEVRAVLGSSARSVFTSPTRSAVSAHSQRAATEENRANGGPGISAQAFGLFSSIVEVRTALAHTPSAHWWETHPETAFALMNNGVPFASKRSALGVAQRLSIVRSWLEGLDDLLLTAPAKVPVDDVLDALAALWSANRIAAGTAVVFGPEGRDDQGFAEGIRI